MWRLATALTIKQTKPQFWIKWCYLYQTGKGKTVTVDIGRIPPNRQKGESGDVYRSRPNKNGPQYSKYRQLCRALSRGNAAMIPVSSCYTLLQKTLLRIFSFLIGALLTWIVLRGDVHWLFRLQVTGTGTSYLLLFRQYITSLGLCS